MASPVPGSAARQSEFIHRTISRNPTADPHAQPPGRCARDCCCIAQVPPSAADARLLPCSRSALLLCALSSLVQVGLCLPLPWLHTQCSLLVSRSCAKLIPCCSPQCSACSHKVAESVERAGRRQVSQACRQAHMQAKNQSCGLQTSTDEQRPAQESGVAARAA